MKAKLKKFFKDLWAGIKVGDVRSLFFAALILAIPVFLYSILGSILFGITLSGTDIVIHILLIPLYLVMAYLLLQFLYVLIWRWVLKPLIKKIKGK